MGIFENPLDDLLFSVLAFFFTLFVSVDLEDRVVLGFLGFDLLMCYISLLGQGFCVPATMSTTKLIIVQVFFPIGVALIEDVKHAVVPPLWLARHLKTVIKV